jgi:hypothetical protein
MVALLCYRRGLHGQYGGMSAVFYPMMCNFSTTCIIFTAAQSAVYSKSQEPPLQDCCYVLGMRVVVDFCRSTTSLRRSRRHSSFAPTIPTIIHLSRPTPLHAREEPPPDGREANLSATSRRHFEWLRVPSKCFRDRASSLASAVTKEL